jgi:beta-N-acetylglucosaminidase
MDFETRLIMEGFPESYKDALRRLHALHPNWIFQASHTGLDWNTVIEAESIPGKNTIPNSKSVEWLSFDKGAYDWKTDKFVVYDGTYWVTASRAAIEYYMDPRNFLEEDTVFQFELLRYQSQYQDVQGVENILKGTALHNASYSFIDEYGNLQTYTYAETFIKAAEYSGVSPYHLASRVKQEVVTGPTTLSNSVSGTYKGYEGYYNFYNIGANDSPGGGAIANGLTFAKNGTKNANTNALYLIPWTNPYRSIVGGAYFLGSTYINRGQDTVYLQKFNVTPISTYFHQYMTNVEAPWAESRKIATAYCDMMESPIVFSIPVYLNMPESPAPRPTTQFNPNNRLKSLKVYDLNDNEFALTPTFSQTEYNYYLIVGNEVEAVQIKAATVSKKASIFGGGYIPLSVGNNEIFIPVVAENGDIANYVINIVRE